MGVGDMLSRIDTGARYSQLENEAEGFRAGDLLTTCIFGNSPGSI